MKVKGLLEEFMESLKPKKSKSVELDLIEKQEIVDEREKARPKDDIKKEKGIAI